jgi:acyl carrier protein
MDIFSEIKKMLVTQLSIDKKLVTAEAHLMDDLGAESLSLVELAENIGSRFDIEIQLDDIVDAESVGELVKFVESKIK